MSVSVEKNNQLDNSLVDGYMQSKVATESAIATAKVNLPFEVEAGEEYFVKDLGQIRKKSIYSFVKRVFDFFVSLISLVILAVPFLFVAIIIKCTSRGPVFYKQERLGKNGKKFKLIKFRSMCVDAEKNGARWSGGDNDDRIYGFGKFLRVSHIDELPQLFCILTGKMSLIGPRPEREMFYNEFEKYIHGFSQRLKVKPGLTGYAQVNGGYDLKPQEKIVLDIEYIKKRSVWLDVKILFKTVIVVLGRKGVK